MDLILFNGTIWRSGQPMAQALAVKHGRISAVGSNEDILRLRTRRTLCMDVNDRLVLPGFNDSHAHFLDGGFHLLGVNLRDADSPQEFCRRLAAAAARLPAGTWITGGLWDHERWPGKALPHRAMIDAAVPEHPVFVVRLDWHIGVANSLALQSAGIGSDSLSPAGGAIDKESSTGAPTGILRDDAMRLITRVVPPPAAAEQRLAMETAMRHAASLGVTSVQGQCSEAELAFYQELNRAGALKTRISAWHPIAAPGDIEKLANHKKLDTPFLRSGTAKLFSDGSFGASTAWLFEPYEGTENDFGLAIHAPETLGRMVAQIDALGWQMAIHAIGDRAVHETLNALEQAQAVNAPRDRRHRIEHAQMVRSLDVPRLKKLGIVASVQPSHAIDDMRWIADRIGTRVDTAYRCRSFLDLTVPVAFGTDWTVEPLSPLLTLYAAVTREMSEGGPTGGWQPQERISIAKALSGYTRGSAFAEGTETVKGHLRPGFYADFIVLDQNILQTNPHDWLSTQVDLTVLNGEVIYDRNHMGFLTLKRT